MLFIPVAALAGNAVEIQTDVTFDPSSERYAYRYLIPPAKKNEVVFGFHLILPPGADLTEIEAPAGWEVIYKGTREGIQFLSESETQEPLRFGFESRLKPMDVPYYLYVLHRPFTDNSSYNSMEMVGRTPPPSGIPGAIPGPCLEGYTFNDLMNLPGEESFSFQGK